MDETIYEEFQSYRSSRDLSEEDSKKFGLAARGLLRAGRYDQAMRMFNALDVPLPQEEIIAYAHTKKGAGKYDDALKALLAIGASAEIKDLGFLSLSKRKYEIALEAFKHVGAVEHLCTTARRARDFWLRKPDERSAIGEIAFRAFIAAGRPEQASEIARQAIDAGDLELAYVIFRALKATDSVLAVGDMALAVGNVQLALNCFDKGGSPEQRTACICALLIAGQIQMVVSALRYEGWDKKVSESVIIEHADALVAKGEEQDALYLYGALEKMS